MSLLFQFVNTLSKHVLLGLRLNKNKITWRIKGISENFGESNTEECSVTNEAGLRARVGAKYP